MPYATREERTAYLRNWYSRNRERQIAAVTARRKRGPMEPKGVDSLHVDGWQERQRYAMEVAKRRYPKLFWRFHDDLEQVAAFMAVTNPKPDVTLARAMQRACYRLEKEIA